MNNMGDHGWLNDYIGIPYETGGRGPNYDCYGLLIAIYKYEYGIDLPDWDAIRIRDLKGNADQIDKILHSGTWEEVEHPGNGDFVVCYRKKMAHHLGLYYAGGVIHSGSQTMGVVYEPLSRFKRTYGNVVFGEWRP